MWIGNIDGIRLYKYLINRNNCWYSEYKVYWFFIMFIRDWRLLKYENIFWLCGVWVIIFKVWVRSRNIVMLVLLSYIFELLFEFVFIVWMKVRNNSNEWGNIYVFGSVLL